MILIRNIFCKLALSKLFLSFHWLQNASIIRWLWLRRETRECLSFLKATHVGCCRLQSGLRGSYWVKWGVSLKAKSAVAMFISTLTDWLIDWLVGWYSKYNQSYEAKQIWTDIYGYHLGLNIWLNWTFENVRRQFCPSFMEQRKTKPSQSEVGLWIVIKLK